MNIDFIRMPGHTVYSYLNRLSINNNTSLDHIPKIFLKQRALSLALQLAIVYDKFLLHGSCPQIWQTVIVKSVFKKKEDSVRVQKF